MEIQVSTTAGNMILDVIESMEGHLYDRAPIPHSALAYWAASLREILIEAEHADERRRDSSGAW
jgi:hypothetical protein